MAQLKDTQIDGNLHVSEDIQIGDVSLLDSLDELNANKVDNSTILNQLLSNPKSLTADDDVLQLSAGIYKAEDLAPKNGMSANSIYIVITTRNGVDKHILEFGINSGNIHYQQMFANTWRGWIKIGGYN